MAYKPDPESMTDSNQTDSQAEEEAKAKEAEAKLAKSRSAVRSGRSVKAQREMRIPDRYWGKSLAELGRHKDLVERAKRAVLAERSVLLSGPPGVGKTHMAVGLMSEYLAEHLGKVSSREKPPPCFVSTARLLMEIKRGFSQNQSELEILEPYLNSRLLVLDDLGSEMPTDWTRQTFCQLVDQRYMDRNPVIITTNLSLAKIGAIDDRLASRLNEMGEIINLQGVDWRVDVGGHVGDGWT